MDNKVIDTSSNYQAPKLLLEESATLMDFLIAYGFKLIEEFDYGFKLSNDTTTIHYCELQGGSVKKDGKTVLEFASMKFTATQIILALHCFDIIDIYSADEYCKLFKDEYRAGKKSTPLGTYNTSFPVLLSRDGLRNLRAKQTIKA